MKRYSCDILYKYKEKDSIDSLNNALGVLGFEPNFMSVYYDEFKKSLNDVPYDKEQMLKIFNNKPASIIIKHQLYNEDIRDKNDWFQIKLNLDSPFGLDTFNLAWSNTNMDFLFARNRLSFFIENPLLIYSYCYDQYDCFQQTNEMIDVFVQDYPGQSYTITKNFMDDDVIDTSQHWGKYISTKGMKFMSAPLMWYGCDFFDIISKEELLSFSAASTVKNSNFEIVNIKLFDLYDNPSYPANRLKQKEFWTYFNLKERAEKYERDRPFDYFAWAEEKRIKKKR